MDEVVDLLTIAAAYDGRITVGKTEATAWWMALKDLNGDEAQTAAVKHYQRTSTRLTPADIRVLVRGSEAERHPSAKRLPAGRQPKGEVARRGADLSRLFIGERRRHPTEPLAISVIIGATPSSESTRRRALVLKHPDLAKRLCEPPLSYARPEQWNGYIPPGMCSGSRNTSAEREALLEICAEAEARGRPESGGAA